MHSQSSQHSTLLDGWWGETWTPPALLNPWEWCEAELELSARITSRPGQFSTALTPYVREPMECFADPSVRRVVLCWAAQTSKTTTLAAMLAYSIGCAPGPVLWAMPSLEMARSFSENRLMPMINDCPALARQKTGDRHHFKKGEIILARQTIALTGANANQLSSRPVKFLFLDETDKFPAYDSDKAEADLVSLAIERTKSFRDCKILVTSTPTVPDGPIWGQFKSGDQRYFHVPCVHCGAFFRLEWPFVKWPDVEDPEKIRNNTWVQCPNCAGRIEETAKNRLLSGGRWVPDNPTANPDTRSYHLSELYSPFSRWGALAVKFIEATREAKKGLTGPLHNFINSSLSAPWEVIQEDRKPDLLFSFRDQRARGAVPDTGVLGLTAGIDVQDNGFYFVVYAWGKDLEGWLISEGFVDGWDALDSVVFKSVFRSPSGKAHTVLSAFIDSGGHRTAEVYAFARKNRRARPIKGEQELSGPWSVSKIDKFPGTNNPMPSGISLVRLNTRYFKDIIAGKLDLTPDMPGVIHFHSEISSEFAEHMAAEYRDERGVWRCARHRRRDWWDATVYALAACDMFRLQNRAQPVEAHAPAAEQPANRSPSREEPNPYLSHNNPWTEGTMNPGSFGGVNPYTRR